MKIESTKIERWEKQSFEDGGGKVKTDDTFRTITLNDSLEKVDYELPNGVDESEFVAVSVGWDTVPIKIKELERMIKFLKANKKGDDVNE